MAGSTLGPAYTTSEAAAPLDALGACWCAVLDDDELFRKLAQQLAAGKVVGWFQGRMEFGPRGLGARSILGDPRNSHMQSLMNLKIK